MTPEVTQLLNRFETLAYRTMRRHKIQVAPPRPPVDPMVEETERMGEFARASLTKKRWLPWVDAQRAQAAQAVRHAASVGGAGTQFAAGYEAALHDMIEKLRVWGQLPAPDVETRPMRSLEGVSK